jgi:hypothetical protein
MDITNIIYTEPLCFLKRKCKKEIIGIPEEIVNLIMDKLDRYEDKNNFSMINSFIYKNYHKRVKIYKLEKYLNKDYIRFYNLLQIYEYDKEDLEYLKKICIKSVEEPPTIWLNDSVGYADLRFIFELMYHYNIINKYTINKGYLPTIFFRNIKQCIVKNNRLLTLKNINNMGPDYILSLKKSFNPCSDKNKDKWIKLLN